jgi:hypothetical protein
VRRLWELSRGFRQRISVRRSMVVALPAIPEDWDEEFSIVDQQDLQRSPIFRNEVFESKAIAP